MKRKVLPGKLTFVVINGEPQSYGYSDKDGNVPFKTTLTMKQMDGATIVFLQPDNDDWDDFYYEYDDDAWGCDLCGGEGVRELHDAPEEWGEDCCVEPNRLIECRGCHEVERDKYLAMAHFLMKRLPVKGPRP